MNALKCGCEFEIINGKVIWIYCDEHDVDVYEKEYVPIHKVRRRDLDVG